MHGNGWHYFFALFILNLHWPPIAVNEAIQSNKYRVVSNVATIRIIALQQELGMLGLDLLATQENAKQFELTIETATSQAYLKFLVPLKL